MEAVTMHRQAGATAVEYALILSGIFLVIVTAVAGFGQAVLALFDIPPF